MINLPPVGCPQDSHRCFLLHDAGQRETVQYLRPGRKMLIGSLPLSTSLFSFSHTHTAGGGGRFITITPEDVTAHIIQLTRANDEQSRANCQKRKRRKTHRDQKCVSVSIATHRQFQQPGAPRVIKQREKGAERGWSQ